MSQTAEYVEADYSRGQANRPRARQRSLRRETVENQPLASLPFPLTPHELRKLRKSMSLSQAEFGELVGVGGAQIGIYERGQAPVPGYVHEKASKLARAQSYKLAGLEPPPEQPTPRRPFLQRLADWLGFPP